jgi:enolase-phosphatase E1
VTVSLSDLQIRAIVLDIEGTTTPVDFVYAVLFPFARDHAGAYLQREGMSPACRAAIERLLLEQAEDRSRGLEPPIPLADYVGWLMDADRKSPGLKSLQGLIWQEGYTSGELHGRVYPDVAPAFRRWRAQRIAVYIYSSGSVLAQQLLFASTEAGDLTAYLSGYFDTAVGPKTSAASYRAISETVGVPPSAILFVSDAVGELTAAVEGGLLSLLCVRDDGPLPRAEGHSSVRTFDEIVD